MVIIPIFPDGTTKNLYYANSDSPINKGDIIRMEGHPPYVCDEVKLISSKTLNIAIINLLYKEEKTNGDHRACS